MQNEWVVCEMGNKLANKLQSAGGDQCFLFRMTTGVPQSSMLGSTLLSFFSG